MSSHLQTCKSCGAPVRWGTVPKTGRRMPLNPDRIRASHQAPRTPGNHKLRVLMFPDGTGARVFENPNGDLVGYESHFGTCPDADQHRRM